MHLVWTGQPSSFMHFLHFALFRIIPVWSTQAYFTMVLNMLIDYPRVFSATQLNLVHPRLKSPHPLHKTLILMACRLSGDPSMSSIFQKKLPMLSCNHGDHLLRNNTRSILISGCNFVNKDRLIRCLPLLT